MSSEFLLSWILWQPLWLKRLLYPIAKDRYRMDYCLGLLFMGCKMANATFMGKGIEGGNVHRYTGTLPMCQLWGVERFTCKTILQFSWSIKYAPYGYLRKFYCHSKPMFSLRSTWLSLVLISVNKIKECKVLALLV